MKERTQYEEDMANFPEQDDDDKPNQMELPLDFEDDDDEDSQVPSFDDWPYDEPLRFAPFGVD